MKERRIQHLPQQNYILSLDHHYGCAVCSLPRYTYRMHHPSKTTNPENLTLNGPSLTLVHWPVLRLHELHSSINACFLLYPGNHARFLSSILTSPQRCERTPHVPHQKNFLDCPYLLFNPPPNSTSLAYPALFSP